MILRYLSKIAKRAPGADDETGGQEIIGYLALTETSLADLPDVKPGLVLDNKTDAPPWHVVDHDLRNMTIPDWPISLWKVHALSAITPQGHNGNYTRCSAIKFLERLPAYLVFGETDTGIADIVDFGRNMSLEQAQSLAKLRSEDASAIISRVWQRWIKQNGIEDNGHGQDFDGVLSIGRSQGTSPIGSSLLVLSKVVFDQAGKVDAETAYAYGTDNTIALAPPWDTACSTLRDAALSFGASHLCDNADIEELRRPMRHVNPDLVRKIENKEKR